MSSTTLTILGAVAASITAALGFGDLQAVFGAGEPIARFVLTIGGAGLSFALGKTNPGNGY